MKKIIFAFILSIINMVSFGQSFINENFESWIDNSAFIDPEGWVTLNDLSPEYGIPFTVLKSTDAKSGMYAAHMQTYTFNDGNNNTDTLPSIMVYGTDINSGVKYTWTKRLKSVSFSYKYKPNGIDTGIFYLTTGYRDKKTNMIIDNGFGYYLFTKKEDNYTVINIPIYYSTNNICDTFKMAFINSVQKENGNRYKPGTVLLIDDLVTEWENFPAVANIIEPEIEIGIFPNPTSDVIHFKGLLAKEYSLKIIDNTGRIILSQSIENEMINIEMLNIGMYQLNINSKDGLQIGTLYFIKN